MKNIVRIFLAITFVFICVSVSAQTYMNEEPESVYQDFQKKNSAINFLSTQEVQIPTTQVNLVSIQQVGTDNLSEVQVVAQTSTIVLNQTGNFNTIGLDIKANQVTQVVNQYGENHSFLNFSPFSNIQNLQVQQSGEGQNLIFHGGNSISERMIITMSGQNQFIEVRNFN